MFRGDLATAACAKYNNMVASDEYGQLDPKDAKILVLTTKVTALEKSFVAHSANAIQCGGAGGDTRGHFKQEYNGDVVTGVKQWRNVNKGPTLQHGEKTVGWCPKHK